MTKTMTFCRSCERAIHQFAATCTHCHASQIIKPTWTPTPEPAKSKFTAGVLALLLGGIGIHKFYMGAWGWGLVYIVFCWTWIPALAALVESIRYLTLSDADFQRKTAQLDCPFAFLWSSHRPAPYGATDTNQNQYLPVLTC